MTDHDAKMPDEPAPPPLSPEEFAAWAAEQGFPNETISLLEQIRRGDPARRTDSGTHHVAGRFASRKMRCTLSFESHRGELSWLWLHEHDPKTLEMYDQPGFAIPLEWMDAEGRVHRSRSTPDYLSIEAAGAVVHEVKATNTLRRYLVERPGLFVENEDGTWSCPSADAWATKLGLAFRVWSTDDLPQLLARNEEFLDDFVGAELPSADVQEAILAVVRTEPGITLASLLRRLDPEGALAPAR